MDFSFSPALVIMNIAYVLTLAGLAVRNFLVLRLLMISAQVLLIYAGAVRGNPIVVFWNSVFLVINLYRTITLLLERRKVKLPEDLQDIYDLHFFQMTGREFLRFWKLGEDRAMQGGYIIRKGQKADSVYMITSGKVYVQNNINTVAILGRGDFVGEMSFISGKSASADVLSDMDITLRVWKSSDLLQLKEKNNNFWIKVQQTLSHDLVTKVRKSTDQNLAGQNL